MPALRLARPCAGSLAVERTAPRRRTWQMELSRSPWNALARPRSDRPGHRRSPPLGNHRWPGRNGRADSRESCSGSSSWVSSKRSACGSGTTGRGGRRTSDQIQSSRWTQPYSEPECLDPRRALADSDRAGTVDPASAPSFRIAAHFGIIYGSSPAGDAQCGGKAGRRASAIELRYRSAEMHRPSDDPAVVAITRNSNSMDVALLVNDLVPLPRATPPPSRRRREQRLDLADAILHGICRSGVALTRLDLLGPCSRSRRVPRTRRRRHRADHGMGATHVADSALPRADWAGGCILPGGRRPVDPLTTHIRRSASSTGSAPTSCHHHVEPARRPVRIQSRLEDLFQ